VSFPDLGGEPLAAVADNTAPLVHSVGNFGVGTKRLWNRDIQKARLGDAFVTGNTTVHNPHLRNPDLVNRGVIIREESFGIRALLSETKIVPLVTPPFSKCILNR